MKSEKNFMQKFISFILILWMIEIVSYVNVKFCFLKKLILINVKRKSYFYFKIEMEFFLY